MFATQYFIMYINITFSSLILQKKFEGTKCTVENFMAWKLKFDEETRERRLALKMKQPDANKLTGKI